MLPAPSSFCNGRAIASFLKKQFLADILFNMGRLAVKDAFPVPFVRQGKEIMD